ncbi:MAG: TetR/AcrR family transcriptional regulator [Sphingomonas sp.]|uniref:TetR/AcrR family transcriptional regulator n=1 Tax=Sphingomonas sp. TaxID=28214 RepID=UPI003565AD23
MTKRVRKTRVEQQAETRARLLEAAETVFSNMGYHGSSIELVAAEAGYSKGAVYSNFASKEEMFLALLKVHMDRDLEEVGQIVDMAPEDLFPANTRWLESMHALMPDFPTLMIELQLHARRNPEFAKAYYPLQDRKMAGLADIVTKYFAASGQPVPMDPLDLAYVIEALVHGLSLQQPLREAGSMNEAGAIIDRLMKVLTHRDPKSR